MEVEGPVPFDPRSHDVTSFDCGSPAQTDWLRRVAREAEAAGTARVYVITQSGTGRVIGYHALAAGVVRPEDAPRSLLRGAGRSPVPTILLARLGVDTSAQGLGLGAALVKDATLRSRHAARTIGARALLIHAESQGARDFYLRLAEFDESPTDPLHLILMMSTIADTLDT